MNRTKLKSYAPQARKDFIQAMTDRAAYYGLSSTKIEPVVERGDIAVIAGREHPKAIAGKRKQLEERIERIGSDWTKSFEQLMEAMAYTWFNRFVAIRFMELHGYLEHGYRVLSHPEGKPSPEILEHAEHVDFPGLKKDLVIDLKLAGNKEGELYRLLLTSQCNALHKAMPFLFEKIDDETELLLPDNLLNSDSLIRKLVSEIDEEDWTEVEIIGWIYQFYISDKKDEVIGKVVASEDIPAATQLFTPNWIVKYLVQNTLGRQWVATYPQSALRQQMEYYIESAEQTPDVQEQLNAITPTSLNPEELTLLDPACGSGHILVEAYDLFKAIYQERGYRAKDIPGLILQKNLFGLEIDDRAAQLAAFALMMKARADDRRIFDSDAKPNVVAFVESKGLDAEEIHYALMSPLPSEKQVVAPPRPDGFLFETENNLFTHAAEVKAAQTISNSSLPDITKGDIASLVALFENVKTFGSLIQVPPKLTQAQPAIQKRLNDVLAHGDLTHSAARVLEPLLLQTKLLANQYDAVVANPPYMGSMAMISSLKAFAKENYSRSNSDLFAMFMDRSMAFGKTGRVAGLVVMQSWMFLSSLRDIREHVLSQKCLLSMAHLGARAFTTISGEIVQVSAFSLCNLPLPLHRPVFLRLTDGDETAKIASFSSKDVRYSHLTQDDFKKLPGSPIAYWATKSVADAFAQGTPLQEMSAICNGIKTGNVALFIKRWFEVDVRSIGFGFKSQDEAEQSEFEWFPYCKGGEYRKWYGNNDSILHWQDNGEKLRTYSPTGGVSNSRDRPENRPYFFKPGITWSSISSQDFAVRYLDEGMFFDIAGPSLFPHDYKDLNYLIGFMNSPIAEHLLSCLNTTLNILVQDIKVLPILTKSQEKRRHAEGVVEECVAISRLDWNSFETSWTFDQSPLLEEPSRPNVLAKRYQDWVAACENRRDRLHSLEKQNNALFIEMYDLGSVLRQDVTKDQITLYQPDRNEDIKRLISYAIGCVMGRYSLDKPGLIYAHSGNEGFEPSQYKSFKADDDGIIPVLDADWGIVDDAANRIVEFVSVAWPTEGLEENLRFIAENLGPTGSEQPRETIRRYLSSGFYKHHLSMYKKRPIYWMFSSGKQRAFQCLVYLHRYNEGTLARIRTEYVIPLQGQIAARIDQLEGDKLKASSTSHGKKLQKEQDDLKKKQAELATFEEKLKNAADQKISLDLDDGVKVNYAKFGDLLAESKAITGGKDDE